MDPIYKPLTAEEKDKLNKKGYKEWEYLYFPEWADPDTTTYHTHSFLVLGASLLGRYLCRKYHQPTFLFSLSVLLVPLFYVVAYRNKHIDKKMTPYRRRPTFNEALEHYPVTRRAFNRALEIRDQEMTEIRSKIPQI